jgi:PAS domain S-box-containing protein
MTAEPALATPRPDEIRSAAREHARPIVLARLRALLWLALASFAVFFGLDLAAGRESLAWLTLIKVAQVSLTVGALWALRTRAARHAVGLGLAVLGAFAALAVASAVLRGNALSVLGLYMVFAVGAAAMIPWGPWPQATMVGLFTIATGWGLVAVGGTAPLVSPEAATTLTAGLVSIYVAGAGERYRHRIAERELGLRFREEHFRALIEHGSDIILVADAGGALSYVSPSARRLGYEPVAWLGQAFYDQVDAEDLPRLRRALTGGDRASAPTAALEFRVRDSAGGWHVFDGAIADLLADPAVCGIVLNARDITDLRRTEEAARHRQSELTHALRLATIGEVSSTLAHEINQPLGAIANYANACARRLPPDASSMPDVRRGLELIAAEALRAGEIIRRIRDLGRKDSGEPGDHDVNEIVRRAVLVTEAEARLQRVEMDVVLADRPLAIHGDRIQLEQVLLNLILNGIEAMETTRDRTLSLRTAAVDGTVEVAVRDSGTGFDAALGAQLFEPYFTTKPHGLGMGLAISRRIIEAHGGRLHAAANADGRGSTFSFTLPLAPTHHPVECGA